MIADFYTDAFARYTMAPAVTFPYDLTETLVGTFGGGMTQLRASEIWLDEKMTKKATHRIYCPSSTTILYTDRIKLDSRVFEVRAIDDIEIKSGHHKEILVEEIT